MKAFKQTLGIVAAGLLLTAGPALAQRPDSGGGAGAGGDRASSGSSGGGASSGGGGGGGNIATSSGSSGGGSVSSSDGGGGGFSSPSVAAFASPSVSMGSRSVRTSAPEHRMNYSAASGAGSHTASAPRDDQKATPRSSGGSSSSSSSGSRSGGNAASSGTRSSAPGADRAVTRGSAAGSRRAGEGTSTNNASGANEVPNWSRPRGDRPVTDTATTRVGPRPDRGGGGGGGYDGRDGGYFNDPYYYGGFGYGFGLYDRGYYGYPFYSPFGFGYGIPNGYFDPFYGDPYDYGTGYGAYSSRVYGGHDQGALKLKVKPHNAKVYVDGYFVGTVDEFDGAFQKLTLNGGRHKVEVRAEGYETAEFDVLITPENTVTFAGDLKKVQ